MAVDYTVFVHLSDPSGYIVAQHDSQPAAGAYPTSAWTPGESLDEEVQVPLPTALPSGQYRLTVGLYDLKTMARLPVVDSAGAVVGDEVDLGTVTQ
jgi:hypothetical protein